LHASGIRAVDRTERRKTETAEMYLLKRVSRYIFTDHLHNKTICNTLKLYALEEKIQHCKKSGRGTPHEWTLHGWPKGL
jgi:hypothetical protein